jgi:hypothetical protein
MLNFTSEILLLESGNADFLPKDGIAVAPNASAESYRAA